jgi:exodeoxyribonuclease VII large subunit
MQQIGLFQTSSSNVLNVTQITQYLRALLENDEILKDVWVQGEISNLSLPTSGHIYFTLKDESSALRCVIWKNAAFGIRHTLHEGVSVEAHGSISIYERSGQYQLYVDMLRPAGEGALYQLFLELKAKLEAEGLFSEERKRPLPSFPHFIGIVTSPTGAALQDILNTLRHRFPLAEVILAPTAVQGEEAPQQIVKAIEGLNYGSQSDVIIVARGGGSLEDLWVFNDERVVRAIVASRAPVVTGIGHETDFTLADFAADLRAPTPTGAAVLATPDIQDLYARLENTEFALTAGFQNKIIDWRSGLQTIQFELEKLSPTWRLNQEVQRLDELQHTILRLMSHQLEMSVQKIDQLRNRILSLDPLQVLQRGYAIVSDKSGLTVNSLSKVTINEDVDVRLRDGRFNAGVKTIRKDVK